MFEEQASDFDQSKIRRRVGNGLHQVKTFDRLLFREKVHERAIVHRLALYLEHEFPEWDVDCEYNRKGHFECKRLVGLRKADEINEGSLVIPDIVVHHRGDDDPECNLLVVEVKVTWGTRPIQRDRRKLKEFVGLGALQAVRYRFGVLVLFDQSGAYRQRWYSRPSRPEGVDREIIGD